MDGWPGTHIYFFNLQSLQVLKHYSELRRGFLLPVTSHPNTMDLFARSSPLFSDTSPLCSLSLFQQTVHEPFFVSLHLGIFTSNGPRLPNRRLLRRLASPRHNVLLLQAWDPQKTPLGSVPLGLPSRPLGHCHPPVLSPHPHFNAVCSETCWKCTDDFNII